MPQPRPAFSCPRRAVVGAQRNNNHRHRQQQHHHHHHRAAATQSLTTAAAGHCRPADNKTHKNRKSARPRGIYIMESDSEQLLRFTQTPLSDNIHLEHHQTIADETAPHSPAEQSELDGGHRVRLDHHRPVSATEQDHNHHHHHHNHNNRHLNDHHHQSSVDCDQVRQLRRQLLLTARQPAKMTEQQLEQLINLIGLIKDGRFKEFVELIERQGLKQHLLNAFVNGHTALHYTLLYGRSLDWCKQLVLNGANPNLTNRAGWHPVHLAAYSCSNDTMRYLLDCLENH